MKNMGIFVVKSFKKIFVLGSEYNDLFEAYYGNITFLKFT